MHTWQQLDDLLQLFLKAHLQDPVGLIDDQTLQVLEHESRGVLKVNLKSLSVLPIQQGGQHKVESAGLLLLFSIHLHLLT